MPATRGNLQHLRLHGQLDASPSTFQLTQDLASFPAMVPTTNLAKTKRMNRRGFSPSHLAAMGEVVQSYSSDFMVEHELFQRTDHVNDEAIFTGPEYLFHGSAADWDTIYASGELRAAGDNTSISDHVASSMLNASMYVSGTRVLSVAKSFAKTTSGWVYMFLARHGIGIATNWIHKQAEVAVLANVPVEDIVLFKQLSSPNDVYLNLDFRWGPLSQKKLARCLRALGGGQYGPAPFWAQVT